MSCDNSEYITSVNINDRVPIGIAKDFEMIYTDSMKTRSIIKAPTHQDFSNHPINYFEFILKQDLNKVTSYESKTPSYK